MWFLFHSSQWSRQTWEKQQHTKGHNKQIRICQRCSDLSKWQKEDTNPPRVCLGWHWVKVNLLSQGKLGQLCATPEKQQTKHLKVTPQQHQTTKNDWWWRRGENDVPLPNLPKAKLELPYSRSHIRIIKSGTGYDLPSHVLHTEGQFTILFFHFITVWKTKLANPSLHSKHGFSGVWVPSSGQHGLPDFSVHLFKWCAK